MRFQVQGPADDYTKQVGMTLAEIAYADPENIPRQLAYKYYAGGGAYRLEWLGVTAGNQMYVCRQPGVDQWVVAIRGSVTDPLSQAFWIDWFQQDLSVFDMVALPFGQGYNRGAKIASGSRAGLEDLAAMTDIHTGRTLVEYLRSVKLGPGSVVVLGHSLGGALASLLAPYLYETIGRPNQVPADAFLPITFAAPTVGDQNFADYVNGLFDGFPYRCVNSLDIAPRCWSLSGLDWITRSYEPSPRISAFFRGLVDLTWYALWEEGYYYVQPGGGGNVDPGTLQHDFWWFKEAGYQHAGETYLRMYHAPEVIFPVPPASPVLPRGDRPRPPLERAR
jgi:hypothetical protein